MSFFSSFQDNCSFVNQAKVGFLLNALLTCLNWSLGSGTSWGTNFLFKCQYDAVIKRFSVLLNSVCRSRARQCSIRTCCWKTLLPPPMLLQCLLRARRRVLRRWPLSTAEAIRMSHRNHQSAGWGISPWGRWNEAYLTRKAGLLFL